MSNDNPLQLPTDTALDRHADTPTRRRADGVFRQVALTTRERREPLYTCNHDHLRKDRRCLGCGRTRNEIALDEG